MKTYLSNIKEYIIKNKFIISISAILIFFSIAPYIVAFITTPKDLVFTGFLYRSGDIQTYISKMNNGKKGFEFINNYTNKDNKGGYIFLFYILLGRIANIIHISNELMYHIARVILSLVFLYEINDLTDKMGVSSKAKKIGIILCLFGSSFQFIIDFLFKLTNLDINNGYMLVDMFPSMAILYIPHFLVTMTCQVVVLKEVLIYKKRNIKSAFKISFVLFLIALIHPYTSVLCGFIAGIYILIDEMIEGTFKPKDVLKISIFSVIPLPYLIYCLYELNKSDMLRAWREQSATPIHSISVMSIFTGAIYLIAILLIFIPKNWLIKERRFLTFNILIIIIVANIKSSIQIRLLEGLSIYVFILLGIILGEIIDSKKYKLYCYTAILLFTINSFYLIFQPLLITKPYNYMYISINQEELYNFIKVNTKEESVFLTNEKIGNFIPSKTLRKVALGHNAESINYDKWSDLYNKVLETGDLGLLKDEEVDYFILNKDADYKNINSKIIFENSEFIIYKI